MVNPESWTIDDVQNFLKGLGFPDSLLASFKDNAVTGNDLIALQEDDYLSSLKTTRLQMKKIRKAVESSLQKPNTSIGEPTTAGGTIEDECQPSAPPLESEVPVDPIEAEPAFGIPPPLPQQPACAHPSMPPQPYGQFYPSPYGGYPPPPFPYGAVPPPVYASVPQTQAGYYYPQQAAPAPPSLVGPPPNFNNQGGLSGSFF